jgi:hypothetical protein
MEVAWSAKLRGGRKGLTLSVLEPGGEELELGLLGEVAALPGVGLVVVLHGHQVAQRSSLHYNRFNKAALSNMFPSLGT